jgi:hypothetical protein
MFKAPMTEISGNISMLTVLDLSRWNIWICFGFRILNFGFQAEFTRAVAGSIV